MDDVEIKNLWKNNSLRKSVR